MAEKTVAAATKMTTTVRAFVEMVKTTEPVQFFGVSGSQISSNMQGLHLEWNGEVVVVTWDGAPGKEKWIFPATIAFIGWGTRED